MAPDLLPHNPFWVMRSVSRGQEGKEGEAVGADCVCVQRRLQAKSRAEKTLGWTIFSGPVPLQTCLPVLFGLSAVDC